MQQTLASYVRRAFFYWQSAAVVILPAWLLVGWAAFGSGGWALLLVVLSTGVLGFVLLVILGLVLARRSVRESRQVSWIDVASMSVLSLAVIGTGTFSAVTTWCAVLAVLAAAATIVLAGRQLLAEARARMQAVLTVIERDAQPHPPEWTATEGPDAGRTIRLE